MIEIKTINLHVDEELFHYIFSNYDREDVGEADSAMNSTFKHFFSRIPIGQIGFALDDDGYMTRMEEDKPHKYSPMLSMFWIPEWKR